MIITKNSHVVAFDVDDTLIMWSITEEHEDKAVTLTMNGVEKKVIPHKHHIELMKDFKFRGHYVIVWSQGGWEWAAAAIKALGIEHLVDEVKTKPQWMVDDICPSIWSSRSYMDLNGKRLAYGRNPIEEIDEEGQHE